MKDNNKARPYTDEELKDLDKILDDAINHDPRAQHLLATNPVMQEMYEKRTGHAYPGKVGQNNSGVTAGPFMAPGLIIPTDIKDRLDRLRADQDKDKVLIRIKTKC